MTAAMRSQKLDRYKLETIFHDDYVIHTTYQTDLAAGQRKVGVQTKWIDKKDFGCGGFGVVSLQGTKEGQLRAVKRLPRGMGSPDYSQELIALSKLKDRPDLFVQFLGWYENKYFVFIAMEYIQYGDLEQYLKTPDAKLNAREITRQLLEGLTVLHERNICHRDLKPQNILIASPSPIWVKITDFGGSKLLKGTELRTRLGTHGYLAPEILGILPKTSMKDSSYTNAVDMWSLGSVVHKILTLRIPFSEDIDYSATPFSGVKSLTADLEQTDMGTLLSFCLGKTKFPTEALQQSGASCNEIDFIMSLLNADPESRISANNALKSPWLRESHDMVNEVDFSQLAISTHNKPVITYPHRDTNAVLFTTTPTTPIESIDSTLEMTRYGPSDGAFLPLFRNRDDSLPPDMRGQNRKAPTIPRSRPSNFLFEAVSLYEYNCPSQAKEGNFRYLSYVEGQFFDVVEVKDNIWLARSQDDAGGEFGWVWYYHFRRLL